MVICAISLILGSIIVFVEFFTAKLRPIIDFLRMTNVIYFICFVVIPVYLRFISPADINGSKWPWAVFYPVTDPSFAYASLTALLGYLLILAGYVTVRNLKLSSGRILANKIFHGRFITYKYSCFSGAVLLTIGALSFFIYAYSIGGISFLLEHSVAIRSQEITTSSKLTFLKNVSPLVEGGSFFWWIAIKLSHRGLLRWFARIAFTVSFLLSVLVLWTSAGRVSFFTYLVTFIIAGSIHRNHLSIKKLVTMTILFLLVVLFGRQLFNVFAYQQGFLIQVSSVLSNSSRALQSVLLEFSFPYCSLANAIRDVPTIIGFRYFIDFLLGVAYVIPNRLLNVTLPPTISDVNTALFNVPSSSQIPTDILTFGYMSLGLFGVVAISFFYGGLLRYMESVFQQRKSFSVAVFKTAWMLFVGYRVMYADPQLSIFTGFPLFISTFLYSLPFFLPRKPAELESFQLLQIEKRTRYAGGRRSPL